MEWHINELSLSGQFSSPEAFRQVVEDLLKLRRKEAALQSRLYCSRSLGICQITDRHNFREAILALNDMTFQRLVFRWMDKAGPFWESERAYAEDDYFECDGVNVTEQGLGEAARRRLSGIDACSFSFTGGRLLCSTSPIQVMYWLTQIEIDNCWDVQQLAIAIQGQKTYKSWQDVDQEIRSRFVNLKISDNATAPLRPVPYYKSATDRIFELLGVLDRLVAETDTKGALSVAGKRLLSEHFTGGKAWFTDESDTNKRKFKQEMTFIDPDNPTQTIFCGWHGKIKTPQLRIHFQWPCPASETAIKIVYIGPKITKR